MRALRTGIVWAGAFVLLAATAVSGQPARLLSPLVVGGESHFRLDWQPAEVGGRRVVRGTIQNTSVYPARRIQLLIEGLDASGAVVHQRVEWLGSDLPSGARVDFESPAGGAAATYRVSLFAFDLTRAP
jgi:hypothetical protein